jgi:hypothetical protein
VVYVFIIVIHSAFGGLKTSRAVFGRLSVEL